ncbi:unnamed protein product [Prunus brigantina]
MTTTMNHPKGDTCQVGQSKRWTDVGLEGIFGSEAPGEAMCLEANGFWQLWVSAYIRLASVQEIQKKFYDGKQNLKFLR